MIKVACAGFPVGKKTYEANFQTVELAALFNRFPRMETVQKWRAEAPPHFDFIVCASKIITHSSHGRAQQGRKSVLSSGPLEDSAIARQAYMKTIQIAEALKSRLVFFKMPGHFMPGPDNIRKIQTFFGRPRGHVLFAWEPPKSWPAKLVGDLSDAYRLMPVMNPLGPVKPPRNSPMRYYRMGANGKTSGLTIFSHEELKKVKSLCDTPLCYVVFDNGPSAFEDALRFSRL